MVAVIRRDAYWTGGASVLEGRLAAAGVRFTLVDLPAQPTAAVDAIDALQRERPAPDMLLTLIGYPEPLGSVVRQVRARGLLSRHLSLGDPAGRPVFPDWWATAGDEAAMVPFLAYAVPGGLYAVPEETQSELAWPKLAYVQLVLLAGTGVAALVGFLFGWTQGRPLLEIPTSLDVLVVVGALLFLANVGWTMLRARRFTATQGSLLAGLVLLALLYLFGMPFYRNLAVDWYYWWWVIHLWVEGAWELVTAALVAFMLIQLTGVDRKVIEKWLYVELGLFLFTGIAGTGHHYYWLAAPRYWLWVGGIFSELEPFPVLLMLIDTWRVMKRSHRPLEPRLTWVFLFGMAILHFVGAGVFGFAHTLPQINYYTHGSQVTVSHGHLAFYGAYALVNLSFFYFAIPRLKQLPDARYDERAGHWGFWITSIGLVGMSLAFAVAGVLQAYLERYLGQPYIVAQDPIRFWMAVVFCCGLVVLTGALVLIRHLLALRPASPGG